MDKKEFKAHLRESFEEDPDFMINPFYDLLTDYCLDNDITEFSNDEIEEVAFEFHNAAFENMD